MSTVGETVMPTEESAVLTEGEVNTIMSGESIEETPILPSDNTEFIMPDKFKGKSVEEIARSYLELEKMKVSEPEAAEEEVSLESEEDEEAFEEDYYNELVNTYETTGALSAEQYATLAEEGYTKEQVDAEISAYNDSKEFLAYKQEKHLNSIIEPLGGGQDKFKAVAQWANESKTVEDVKAFNAALSSASTIAQQAMLRGLYAEYESAGNNVDTVLHTNTSQSLPSKGYRTQEEFFKDIGSEEYKNNPAYRAAVEKKMSVSSIF